MNKVLFMGRKNVAAKALEWLYDRDDVMVVGVITDHHLTDSPTAEVAKKNGLEIFEREQFEKGLTNNDVVLDYAFSVLYWKKIRSPIVDLTRNGVINFHPAPLPDYKGTAGYNLAILEGHSKWAVSAHYVDHGFDTGDIIDVSWFDVDRAKETAWSLEQKAQPELLTQFKCVADKALLADTRLKSWPNNGGHYVSRKEMEAMKEIKPGDDIERKIRAFWFPPYDGAYMVLNGIKCTLIHKPILDSLAPDGVGNVFSK